VGKSRAGTLQAIAAFYRASPGLTVGLLALATLGGLLVPALTLATGPLVQAIQDGSDYTPSLVTVALVFAAQRVLDPIRAHLGLLLYPRVDEWLGDRIMSAVSAPPGLQELESPQVQDRIAQARGMLAGFTPGAAAEYVAGNVAVKIQAIASLAIVARFYWWAALALLLAYAVSFGLTRGHYREVTLVIWGQTDRLRRAYYLRSLALSSQVAKEIRIFDLAHWLVQRYRESSLAVLEDVWHKRNEGWVAALAITLIMAGVELAALGFVVTDAVGARITLGTAVIVAQAVLTAGLLSRYEDSDWGLAESAASIGRVAELEASLAPSQTAIRGSASKRDADELPRHLIRFEDVTFVYPGRPEPVLHHFNLEIRAGHSLAIVGENGAGKTTLVKLLTRLYDPTAGRVTVDGVDLREIDPRAWHRRVSALFQDFARFEMRAYDNVAFGALHAYSNAAAVTRAARESGVLALVERLNNGWDTTLSREFRDGAELSGGEWQRLALARALFGVASGAGVLILDEPTASMDVRGEAEIYRRFLELTRGVTTIVISHRFSTVRRADRIIVVEHGQVIEDGTHDELVARPKGRYAEMYTLQASRFADESEPVDA
jgi:ABC-type multidrug transport system fused ATPase/permease subunit